MAAINQFADVSAARAAASTRPVVFLVSQSAQPCGVEMFERGLAQTTQSLGTPAVNLAIGEDGSGVRSLWRVLGNARALVVSLPIVAWKKALLTPLIALVIARLRGVQVVIILHEWADLNPMRRACISLYLLFAKSILVSSPAVRRDFESSAFGRLHADKGLIPIPPNIAPPRKRLSTPSVERLLAEKRSGRFIIGVFGSIYPKKQSGFLLEIVREAKKRGVDAFVVFVGSFIKGQDNVEAQFLADVKALGLEDRVFVTGYVETDAEIFSLFDAVDVFVYAFSEGLTSRRGSVLACLQSGRPVVVNAPADIDEFAHHEVFKSMIDRGALRFVPTNATASDFAHAIAKVEPGASAAAPEIFGIAWRDAALALRKVLR